MWEITLQKITGTYHELHGMLCQDQIFHQERNHCQSVVLADGTGNSDINTFCVKEVVEFAAEILLEFVENGRAGRICREDVIRRLMQGVIRIISKYMDTYHLPAEAFASTLMGVAVNHVREEYLLIHLGDGIIIGKNGQQSYVLSYPVNRKANETFLTISENLMERTRVKSGSLAEFDRLVLCSDGVYDYPVGRMFTEQTIWEILDGTGNLAKKEDDQSYIQLRRKNLT